LHDNFEEYFYRDDITGIIKLTCEVICETDWCYSGTRKYMREHRLNEKFFRQVIRNLNQIMPRFFKSRPSHQIFHNIRDKIEEGDDIISQFSGFASKIFPVYSKVSFNRYVDIRDLTMSVSYALDNCRLSSYSPDKIIAFTQYAITTPNKKAGFGTITMNLFSMCINVF
jgi:hypothetical protein